MKDILNPIPAAGSERLRAGREPQFQALTKTPHPAATILIMSSLELAIASM
jgi:hypothetical protein